MENKCRSNKKYPVNQFPAIGAIAWCGLGETENSEPGHVSFVQDFNDKTSIITLSQYNNSTCDYSLTYPNITLPNGPNNRTPSWYIHTEIGNGDDPLTGAMEINTLQSRIFPNPSNGQFQIEFIVSERQAVSILVIDALGREIETKNSLLDIGMHTIFLDLKEPVSGVYQIVLKSTSGVVMNKKVLIQNRY